MIEEALAAFPGIVYEMADAGQDPPIEGKDDLPAPVFAITTWAETKRQSTSIARLVKAALENVGPATWAYEGGSVRVHAVTYLDYAAVRDEETYGADKPLFGTRQQYELIHEG